MATLEAIQGFTNVFGRFSHLNSPVCYLVALLAYRITRHLRSGEAVRADAPNNDGVIMIFLTRRSVFTKGTEPLQTEVNE